MSTQGKWKENLHASWKDVAKQDPLKFWKGTGTDGQRQRRHPLDIPLGTNIRSGAELRVRAAAFDTHMHVVGATGVGKSFFLEGVIKRLIQQGHGVCLMTPHQDIYHRVLDYCAGVNMTHPQLKLAERVIPFDISDTRQIPGFNPVARNARVLSYQVVTLMDAIRKCWGQGNFNETPRLARWLFNTGYGVVESNLTLVQAKHLVDSKPNPMRRAIASRIKNADIRAEWEWIIAQKSPIQDERLESSFNRIREFVGHEHIRLMFGQYKKTLDFQSVLNDGKILLVNLARQTTMGEGNQHLIGTLIVNELLSAAFAREEGKRRPFFFCIDEFQHFASKDICEILDGGRKFGLHLILAHQHLNQLRAKEPEVYYSTMTNARTKVVFGGMMDEDLQILASELFTGELDPDEVKDEIWRVALRPSESTRLVVSNSDSEGGGDSRSTISHESLNELYIPDSDFLTMSAGKSSGVAEGSSGSWQRSRSETLVPWYEYHEERELSSRTFRSLEEQLYIKKAQLKRQARQHAAVLIPDRQVEFVKTATLKEFLVNNRHVDEFKQQCFENAGIYMTPAAAEMEIAAMEQKLLQPESLIRADNRGDEDRDDVD